MAHLLDTGILLRLVNTQDARHIEVRQAVETLATQQEELFTTTPIARGNALAFPLFGRDYTAPQWS